MAAAPIDVIRLNNSGIYGTDISYAYATVSALPVVGTIMTFVNLNQFFCFGKDMMRAPKDLLEADKQEQNALASQVTSSVVDKPEAETRNSELIENNKRNITQIITLNKKDYVYAVASTISNLSSLIAAITAIALGVLSPILIPISLMAFSTLTLFSLYAAYDANKEIKKYQSMLAKEMDASIPNNT